MSIMDDHPLKTTDKEQAAANREDMSDIEAQMKECRRLAEEPWTKVGYRTDGHKEAEILRIEVSQLQQLARDLHAQLEQAQINEQSWRDSYHEAWTEGGQWRRKAEQAQADADTYRRDLNEANVELSQVRAEVERLRERSWPEEGGITLAGAQKAYDEAEPVDIDEDSFLGQYIALGEKFTAEREAHAETRRELERLRADERCDDCGAELSACGGPGYDGIPELDCLPCKLTDLLNTERIRAKKLMEYGRHKPYCSSIRTPSACECGWHGLKLEGEQE